jgi:hypothetical protein
MTALAWVIGLGILGYFLFKSSSLRKYTAVGAGVLIILGLAGSAVYWGVSSLMEQKAKKLITAEQLEQIDFKLGELSAYWDLTGQIKNNSTHTLTGLTIKARAYDCPTESTSPDCEIIGEDDDVYISVVVPPGQTRKVDSIVSFYNMPSVKKHFVWAYEISEIKGEW